MKINRGPLAPARAGGQAEPFRRCLHLDRRHNPLLRKDLISSTRTHAGQFSRRSQVILPGCRGVFDRWDCIITDRQPWRNVSLMTERLEIWPNSADYSTEIDNH